MPVEERSSSMRARSAEVRPHPDRIVREQAGDSQLREVVGEAAGLVVIDRVNEDGNPP